MEDHLKLFTVAGSTSCQEAKQLLDSSGLEYRTIDARESGALPYLDRDFGSDRLPILVSESDIFHGLQGVMIYLKSNGF